MKKSLRLYPLLLWLLLSACQPEKPAEIASATPAAHTGEAADEHATGVSLTEDQYQLAGIEIGKSEPRNLSSVIPVNGVLDVPPQNMVSISTPLGGYVKQTEMLQGMRVKKGQVIATLENPEFIVLQQQYLESKSKLSFLELEYARQKELAEANVSATKTFQQTLADYQTERSRVNALAQRLELIGLPVPKPETGRVSRQLTLRAPISGYVTEVNVNVGKYAGPTDVLFEIVDTDHLHVELTVFEKDVPQLKAGQNIRFTLSNENGPERTAKVYLIGRKIGIERTIRVHGHLDKEDTQLLPGTYVKAFIETTPDRVASLPSAAFVQSEGKEYVFIFRGKRKVGSRTLSDFELLEVKKGVSEDGYAAVTLPSEAAAASFVIKGAYSLLAKMKNTEEEGHGH